MRHQKKYPVFDIQEIRTIPIFFTKDQPDTCIFWVKYVLNPGATRTPMLASNLKTFPYSNDATVLKRAYVLRTYPHKRNQKYLCEHQVGAEQPSLGCVCFDISLNLSKVLDPTDGVRHQHFNERSSKNRISSKLKYGNNDF